MAAPFDTLKLAERLGAGGFSQQQAQTASAALSDALSTEVATKTDVETTRLQLDSKIETVRQQLDAKIEGFRQQLDAKIDATRLQLESKIQEAKADTIKWIFGAIGFQTLVLLGGLITFLKLFNK